MSAAELKLAQDAANLFVAENLVDLCGELVDFSDTGILCEGKIKKLTKMVSYSGTSAQSLAIGMVEHAAVRLIAKK